MTSYYDLKTNIREYSMNWFAKIVLLFLGIRPKKADHIGSLAFSFGDRNFK